MGQTRARPSRAPHTARPPGRRHHCRAPRGRPRAIRPRAGPSHIALSRSRGGACRSAGHCTRPAISSYAPSPGHRVRIERRAAAGTRRRVQCSMAGAKLPRWHYDDSIARRGSAYTIGVIASLFVGTLRGGQWAFARGAGTERERCASRQRWASSGAVRTPRHDQNHA